MTKKERERRQTHLTSILDYAKDLGLQKDRYGNVVNQDKTFRIKFKSNVLRLEKKSAITGTWFNLLSVYYKDLETPIVRHIQERITKGVNH